MFKIHFFVVWVLCLHAIFLSHLITYFQLFIISSQQQETFTTGESVQLPLQTDAVYSRDASAKCGTQKIARSTSTIQSRPSNKFSSRRKLFKHMMLSKTILARTDGSDKIKTMEAVATKDKQALACEHSSSHNLDHEKHLQVEAKVRNEMESASIQSNEILGEEDSERNTNCLIDKLRVQRNILVRSLTTPSSTASDEQSKSMSGSKVTLGKAISMLSHFPPFVLICSWRK